MGAMVAGLCRVGYGIRSNRPIRHPEHVMPYDQCLFEDNFHNDGPRQLNPAVNIQRQEENSIDGKN